MSHCHCFQFETTSFLCRSLKGSILFVYRPYRRIYDEVRVKGLSVFFRPRSSFVSFCFSLVVHDKKNRFRSRTGKCFSRIFCSRCRVTVPFSIWCNSWVLLSEPCLGNTEQNQPFELFRFVELREVHISPRSLSSGCFSHRDDRFIPIWVEGQHSVAPGSNFQEVWEIQDCSVRVAEC